MLMLTLRQTKMKTILRHIVRLTMLRDEDDKRADGVLDDDRETFHLRTTWHPCRSLKGNHLILKLLLFQRAKIVARTLPKQTVASINGDAFPLCPKQGDHVSESIPCLPWHSITLEAKLLWYLD